jgi:RNA polymerase sigma-70 factor (ECF subfamily)
MEVTSLEPDRHVGWRCVRGPEDWVGTNFSFFAWAFHGGRRFRLIPTRANRQPAFGLYLRDRRAAIARANGLFVLTLAGHQISAITRFEPGVLPQFGLPRTLPD